MTTFFRSGFWRTSKNGVLHWVEAHEVSRTDWSRSGYTQFDFARYQLRGMGAGDSWCSTYISPNAKCPVCDANVFFYQNSAGSRVYFDELGPPWPKHPCTDSKHFDSSPSADSLIQPAIRPEPDVTFVRSMLERAAVIPEANFYLKYKALPWTPHELEWSQKRGANSILILRRVTEGRPSRLFLAVKGFPRNVRRGMLLFCDRKHVSWFDLSCAETQERPMKRIRGASRLVDLLVDPSFGDPGQSASQPSA
jgi:hypothetical protein